MRIIKAVLLIALCLSVIPVSALNMHFMNNTAASFFTEEDWRMMTQTAVNALDHTPNGVKVTWRNPETKAWGFVVPNQAKSPKGMPCRSLRIFNSANLVTGESTYTFCKLAGQWRTSG